MRLRTANARKRRKFWRSKGHWHMRANPGVWIRIELRPDLASEGYAESATHPGEIDPSWYIWYPRL